MSDYLSPHYAQSVLIIIDFQNDCVLPGGAMEIPGSIDVLPALTALCQHMRSAGPGRSFTLYAPIFPMAAMWTSAGAVLWKQGRRC